MGRTAAYLVVVHTLELDTGAPVPTGLVARALDRSPAAATGMIQRLAEDGLVQHEPYTGVELTESGRARAVPLSETHETLCRFFRDVLSLDEDTYPQEALSLAGVVDPQIADRLETTVLASADPSSRPPILLPNVERPADTSEEPTEPD